MLGLELLRPGDLMFGPIGGFVPGVLPVGVGQLLLADRTARLSWRRWWRYRHVGVVTAASVHYEGPTVRHADGTYVQPPLKSEMPPGHVFVYDPERSTLYRNGVITAPRLVQAMPGGAEEIELIGLKYASPDHIYLRPLYVSPEQGGRRVAQRARGYVGTPYSFLAYAALALHGVDPVWRIAPEACRSQPLARYIRSTGHMICSQLADQAMADAGFHVFDDGRLPQDVVPAELFRALLAMPGTRYLIPGRTDGWSDGQGW